MVNYIVLTLQSMIYTKVDIHAGEQPILNLIMSHQRIDPDVVLNNPKLLITRLAHALNG
jgi:hypothetical protein